MNVGDQVAVINDTISGVVIQVEGENITIEDQDGFERNYGINELAQLSGDYKLNDQLLSKEIKEKLKSQVEDAGGLKSFEIDLHIEELVESHQFMTNHEILTKQMTVCKGFVQNAIACNTKRIVIIHGKGEGVLKAEIHSFLHKLRAYNGVGLEYHDASFSEYGMGGATEVIFN